MKKFALSSFLVLFLCVPAVADELGELKESLRRMQAEMTTLSERIAELESQKVRDIDVGAVRERPLRDVAGTTPPQGALAGILGRFNPDISVIGDLVYHSTDEDEGELDNNFNLREVEIVLSASVDPYARADFFVAIENEDGETEVHLEEGYLTLLETPVKNLQGKFGKFRPYFGKTNRMHLHSLPWVDYPMVVREFLGEEGFSEAGASLSYLIPNPSDVFSEFTFEVFNNNDAEVFGGGEGSEVVYLTHWKNFFDLTDDTTLEIGGSAMYGENKDGNGADTKVAGVDLTLNTFFFPNVRTTSHTEAFFSKWQQPGDDDIDAWGMFTSLEQQLAQRWWSFFRYDYSQMPTAPDERARAYSAGLTFAQSEYAFWRVQFTHTDHKMEKDSNEVWLQLNFGIGPHRAHEYR